MLKKVFGMVIAFALAFTCMAPAYRTLFYGRDLRQWKWNSDFRGVGCLTVRIFILLFRSITVWSILEADARYFFAPFLTTMARTADKSPSVIDLAGGAQVVQTESCLASFPIVMRRSGAV